MPELDEREERLQPARVGGRTKGDAVVALAARGDMTVAAKAQAIAGLRADSAREAFAAEKLPVVARAGTVEVAVHEIVREGGDAIRLHVVATRDGKPIDGWDVDQRIVCPPLDIVLGDTVVEDPVLAALDVMLQQALWRAGEPPGLREQIEKVG